MAKLHTFIHSTSNLRLLLQIANLDRGSTSEILSDIKKGGSLHFLSGIDFVRMVMIFCCISRISYLEFFSHNPGQSLPPPNPIPNMRIVTSNKMMKGRGRRERTLPLSTPHNFIAHRQSHIEILTNSDYEI
jgi:hypothetical protein